MWMLLIVKLLSFKRYNYPFYKCRENGRQMQCAYSQPVSDKVVPLLFSLFVRFWKQMQCIVSQPLPFLVLQNAYLVAKIQIYIGLEQTIILKNIIPQLLFSIILSHHFMYHSQWVADNEQCEHGLHNLKADKIRKRISHYFGLQPIVLESWITSLTLLRNAYCHHSRV